MITSRDIAKLSQIFVTKDEFQQKFDQLNDRILTSHSEIMGELQAIREELTVGGYRQSKHSDQLENHETRITKLESVIS